MSRAIVAIEHNAELAHRLPILEGKCQNLHGHSWLFKIFVSAEVDLSGVSVDYGSLKSLVRGFIDRNWDHGTALGVGDPLVECLNDDSYHQKLYVFGTGVSEKWPWPTVEAFAEMTAIHIQSLLELQSSGNFWSARVERVEVRETATNFAIWDRSTSDVFEET